jgi:hypothetical protein
MTALLSQIALLARSADPEDTQLAALRSAALAQPRVGVLALAADAVPLMPVGHVGSVAGLSLWDAPEALLNLPHGVTVPVDHQRVPGQPPGSTNVAAFRSTPPNGPEVVVVASGAVREPHIVDVSRFVKALIGLR